MKLLRSRLPLSSWLLVALLPALGLLALGYAFITYRGMQIIILEGFDRKLTAASTITAAFIDPAEHFDLTGPLPVGGGAIDAGDGGLWAAHQLTGEFIRIDPSSGQADFTGVFTSEYAPQTASGDQPGTLFVADSETGAVQRVSTDTGEATPAFELGSPFYAMATDTVGRQLYVAGREFTRIDLRTQERTPLAPLPFQPRDMTFDPTRQALWVLDPQGDALLEVDAADGRVRRELPLRYDPAKPFDPEGPTAFSHPDLPVALQSVVFDPFNRRLLGLGSSLLVIDPETGYPSGDGFVHAFGREKSKLYLQYARLGRSLHNRIDTTFLYTQLIHNRRIITYGLDAGIGEDHSPLLSVDELPDEAIEGVQAAIASGTVYAGGVQRWNQWGLIKSVVAPIFDPETGRVAALAGADVDIGTIQFDTHRALVITVSAGLAMMLAAGLLALVIARKLTAPLGVIRAGALRAAAGDYSQRVEITHPQELKDLARQFSVSSATLQDLVRSLQSAVARRQANRDATALEQRLSALGGDAPPESRWAWGESGDEPVTACGVVRGTRCALVWLAPTPRDPSGRTLQAATFAALARALLRQHGPDRAALAASLMPLPDHSAAWLLLTEDHLTVLAATPEANAAVHVLDAATTVVAFPPLPAAAVQAAAGQAAGPALASLHRTAPAGTFLLVAQRS